MSNIRFIPLDKDNWREQRTRVFEGLFDWSKIKTVLYIGARAHKFYLRDVLEEHKTKITVMEIYPPNVEHMSKDRSLEVIEGDAVSTKLGRKFDMVLFWNGPEHLGIKDLPRCIDNLLPMSAKYLVFGAPYGIRPQGTLYNNEHENHRSTLLARDFDGFECVIVGKKDHRLSQLIAYKQL